MNAYDRIKARQAEWARRRGIELVGSDWGVRPSPTGKPFYTKTLAENLFIPLSDESRWDFDEGDGDELGGKMRAVHSSSAFAVNIFEHWRQCGDIPPVARACGLPASEICGLRFERKFPVTQGPARGRFPRSPNLDVVIRYDDDLAGPVKAAAVEVKFSEPYRPGDTAALKAAYVETECLWDGVPELQNLAADLLCDPDADTRAIVYRHLDAVQLVRHILGLKNKYGARGYRLLYLYYDVDGEEGERHRQELEHFASVAAADGVPFTSLSFQELLNQLARHRWDHAPYLAYLEERYLGRRMGTDPLPTPPATP